MKRPPVTERTIEEVEVVENESGDLTVVDVTEKSVNLTEKNGFVKEYIETEGLAIILSKVPIELLVLHVLGCNLNSSLEERVRNDRLPCAVPSD